ncbi:hypothetical protein B0H14DRAFT_2732029, partial [Mycena olivaceomarginata]
MSSDPSPFFPLELEREIFEIAAYFHPETIPSLVLVSRRVYEWIDGIKYSAVTPTGAQRSCSVRHLLRAIQSDSKPASFFHRHVRHVFVNTLLIDGPEFSDIQQILSTCSGVQNFMIHSGHKYPESMIPGIAALKPRRLCMLILRDMDPRQPCSLSSRILTCSIILAACKSLRVFVFFPLRVGDAMGSLPSIDDVRFVYIEFRSAMLEAGWLARTRGGTDFWARADAFVEKKQRGEIRPGSRCFIEPADGIPEC